MRKVERANISIRDTFDLVDFEIALGRRILQIWAEMDGTVMMQALEIKNATARYCVAKTTPHINLNPSRLNTTPP